MLKKTYRHKKAKRNQIYEGAKTIFTALFVFILHKSNFCTDLSAHVRARYSLCTVCLMLSIIIYLSLGFLCCCSFLHADIPPHGNAESTEPRPHARRSKLTPEPKCTLCRTFVVSLIFKFALHPGVSVTVISGEEEKEIIYSSEGTATALKRQTVLEQMRGPPPSHILPNCGCTLCAFVSPDACVRALSLFFYFSCW